MITPAAIALHVAAHLGVALDDVRDSANRTRTVVRARTAIVYWLRVDRGCSWGECARAAGLHRSTARELFFRASQNPDPEIAIMMAKETA